MRVYSDYAIDNEKVKQNLESLLVENVSTVEYSNAFLALGNQLGTILSSKIQKDEKVVLACSSEDADGLMKGILDCIVPIMPRLAVFWNLRSNPFQNEELAIAPIVKSYLEHIDECDTLIICKSIIYTSCVVRTNLIFLIEKIQPRKIFVVAPVIFEGAEDRLVDEFPKLIRDKFQFLYFAKDDVVNNIGEVIPGIGGSIYKKLGLGNAISKNKYVPEIVRERRASFV